MKRIAKTRVGRKILKMREPQVKEGIKNTLLVKNLKTSEEVSSVLQDLYRLKKGQSV